MNCGTYTICLTKKQAKLCAFPPKTPVYVLDDDGHISSRCKVDKVLMTLNPPQLVYQVKSRFSTEYTSEDKLRFQVGCKVDVQHRLSKQSIQSLRGIVVGTCKISCKKSNNDHGNLNVSTVGYSIEVERHKSSCDHSPIGTILHVHPRDVSLRINKATNLDEDSLSTGKKLNASLRKNTEFKKQNKCKKKSKVLNIHITSNRKRTFCELVVGCPSGDVKPKEGSKTVKKRRSDYSKEGNIENSSEDDASMCSMLTEIDTRKEVPGFISDDHQSTRDFGDFPVGRPLGLYEISI